MQCAHIFNYRYNLLKICLPSSDKISTLYFPYIILIKLSSSKKLVIFTEHITTSRTLSIGQARIIAFFGTTHYNALTSRLHSRHDTISCTREGRLYVCIYTAFFSPVYIRLYTRGLGKDPESKSWRANVTDGPPLWRTRP